MKLITLEEVRKFYFKEDGYTDIDAWGPLYEVVGEDMILTYMMGYGFVFIEKEDVKQKNPISLKRYFEEEKYFKDLAKEEKKKKEREVLYNTESIELLRKCGAYEKLIQLSNGEISEDEMIGKYYYGKYLIFEVTKQPDFISKGCFGLPDRTISGHHSYCLNYFHYHQFSIAYTNKQKILEFLGVIENNIPEDHFECWECGRIQPQFKLQDDGTCGC